LGKAKENGAKIRRGEGVFVENSPKPLKKGGKQEEGVFVEKREFSSKTLPKPPSAHFPLTFRPSLRWQKRRKKLTPETFS